MSARLTPNELSQVVISYLLNGHDVEWVNQAFWCTDKREFDDPEAAFYPDIQNRFPSCLKAMEYIMEEGLPVWLVSESSKYPLELFTYHKLEVLFNI